MCQRAIVLMRIEWELMVRLIDVMYLRLRPTNFGVLQLLETERVDSDTVLKTLQNR